MHAIIANVEANFCTGIPPTLIKDTAAPLLGVQAAVLEDPKVGFSVLVLLLLLLRGRELLTCVRPADTPLCRAFFAGISVGSGGIATQVALSGII